MTGRRRYSLIYNFIVGLALLTALGLSLPGMRGLTAVALEQAPRCAREEHVHEAQCYMGDVLLCGKKAHSHSENCYLILLRENDVNLLLETADKADDHSLEKAVADTVERVWSSGSGGDPTLHMSTEELRSLNGMIGADEEVPFLSVNENLTNAAVMALEPEDLGPPIMGNVSVMEVGGNPSTGTRAINFYIRLDNQITFVSSGQLTSNTPRRYTYANTAAAYNQYLVTELTESSFDSNSRKYWIRYNTDGAIAAARDFDTEPGYSNSGNRMTFGNGNSVRYALLTTKSGNTYTPVDFYTVTLDYSLLNNGTANQVQYVQSGLESTLTPDSSYDWYTAPTGGTKVTGGIGNITGTTTLYARHKNHTVTFISAGSAYHQTNGITPGSAIAAPTPPQRTGYTFGGWYTDEACTNPYDFSSPVNSSFSLYAKWTRNQYQVTYIYHDSDGNVTDTRTQSVPYGDAVGFPAGYTWQNRDTGDTYEAGGHAIISGDTVFEGTVKSYTVTVTGLDGSTTRTTVEHGKSFALETLPSGGSWVWLEQSSGTVYESGAVIGSVTGDLNIIATNQVTAQFIGKNGTSARTAVPGTVITIPAVSAAGNVWVDEEGRQWKPGDTLTLTENMVFTEKAGLTVNYNVNFPSGAVSAVDVVPTIYGTTSATASDTVLEGNGAVTHALTSRKARDEISTSNKESVTYFFRGWTISGTDLLIQPGAALSWEELAQYADANGSVNLVGDWETGGRLNSVTFFVRFDSVAVDTEGNITSQPTANYTPEVFNTHLGGVDSSWTVNAIKQAYEIADTTADNSYSADQEIRTLYGEKASGVWMYDFPMDDDVFAYLKDYLAKNPDKSLTVNGVKVDPAELDREHYAIRWYVFKLEGSSWHVDGKLVLREGNININKFFGGEEAAVTLAKDGFHVLAENGTKDAGGVFTPYASTDGRFRQVVLVLDQATANTLKTRYPNAVFQVIDGESADSFHWEINHVTLGEYWRVTEYPNMVDEYSYYAEYSVYDTDGAFTAIAETGTQASVVGKAYALDEDPDQGMLVDFSNYYYDEDHILLKKEDVNTGQGIPGAVFEIWQNGNPLKFNVEDGVYIQNPDGTVTGIETGADGFAVISSFSYEHDSLIIKELRPPDGYDVAPTTEIGLDAGGKTVIVKDVQGVETDRWEDYAEVPSNDVAVIKDRVSEYVSVTVSKVWDTEAPADRVEIVLQANGSNAASLIPGLTNAQAALDRTNSWTHTWTNLPRYANGHPVEWGVKEVVVGRDPTMSDGVSFANWIVTYSPAVRTDADGDGDIDNWAYTVTNTPRRCMLILTKVDNFGNVVSGASFTLERVQLSGGSWQPVSGTAAVSMTTDSGGMLTFDNLLSGAYYRLTETGVPAGYRSDLAPVVVTVDGMGQVQKVNADGTLSALAEHGIFADGLYHVRAVNTRTQSLPETGGTGKTMYIQCGALLLAAAALYIEINKRRRGDRVSL